MFAVGRFQEPVRLGGIGELLGLRVELQLTLACPIRCRAEMDEAGAEMTLFDVGIRLFTGADAIHEVGLVTLVSFLQSFGFRRKEI